MVSEERCLSMKLDFKILLELWAGPFSSTLYYPTSSVTSDELSENVGRK